MPKRAAYTFFAIPELVVLLCHHICKHDLIQCILVCKDWSRQLTPILWKEILIDNRVISIMTTFPSSRIARNLSHVQTLDFSYANDYQLQLLVRGLPYHLGSTVKDPSSGCTNLTQINISALDDVHCLELMSKPLVTLLEYNHRLTRLDVPCEFFDIDGVSAAVSKLWNLQQLDVRSVYPGQKTMQRPLLFLQSCLALPELIELTFQQVELYWDDADETAVVSKLEAIINEATIARFSHASAKRIKSLQLPCNLTGVRNPLPLLLLKSKLLDLETCEIPWFRSDATTREIEDVVRKHCPNLKHLKFPQCFCESQDGQAARAFIRGCSGLQSFTSASFVDSIGPGPRMILSELVTHHCTTLEVFELTDPVQVFSRDLQSVLAQCKQLKRFWVVNEVHEDSMPAIAHKDIAGSDWVCTELRELGVTLNRCRSGRKLNGDLEGEEDHDDPHGCWTASTTKRVFQQIGRLKKLEVLDIAIEWTNRTKANEQDYAWDLTLEKGWLVELAGLTSLRSLRLKADFWSCMNQEDLEFIHEQWPLLDEIIINGNISQLRTKRHWQWLQEKKPYLSIRRVKYY